MEYAKEQRMVRGARKDHLVPPANRCDCDTRRTPSPAPHPTSRTPVPWCSRSKRASSEGIRLGIRAAGPAIRWALRPGDAEVQGLAGRRRRRKRGVCCPFFVSLHLLPITYTRSSSATREIHSTGNRILAKRARKDILRKARYACDCTRIREDAKLAEHRKEPLRVEGTGSEGLCRLRRRRTVPGV